MDVETALSPEIAIVPESWQDELVSHPPQEPEESVEYLGAPELLGDADAGVKSPTIDPSTRCKIAVNVRGLELWYGAGENKVEIFKGINVQVPRGVIYALLGSSGCGKTTLLRIILGRKPFQRGHIRVFGLLPGTPGSKIPGSNVGYMPQELALYDSFSIQETLVFFSRLYNLPKAQIEERTDFLLEFLELPERTRLVHYLSGGQKRRVSLAAALVHSPPLLILDEPTVGIDPVLRKSIWEHLVTLAAKDKMTIIITTHYIDEARLAGQVGFLRQGKLLAQAPPEDLMRRYNASNLEEVFLQLAQGEAKDSPIHSQANVLRTLLGRASSHFHRVSDSEYSFMQSVAALTKQERLVTGKDLKRSWARTSAILYKNMIKFRRSYSLLLYSFLLPSIEVMIFVAVVGRTPFGLTLATVNEDNGTAGIGASFLKLLDSTVMPQVEHTDLGQALESVSSGRAYGAIHIGGNFSTTFETRFGLAGGYHISEDQARMSTISLHLDMSNQQILMTINFYLRKASEALLSNYFQARNLSTAGLNSVVELVPVYGSLDATFTDFVAPGMILTISYFMAVGLCVNTLLGEKTDGILERCTVAGVKSFEIVFAHVCSQMCIIVVQDLLLLFVGFVVFHLPSVGPVYVIVLLTLLQGTCGMALGFMISSMLDSPHAASMLTAGINYPSMMISGILWPVEGIPMYVRWLSYVLPLTLPAEAFRSVMSKGWGLTHPSVLLGILASSCWTVVFLAATVFTFRY